MQSTRQGFAWMVTSPDGFACETPRLRCHLMLEDKQRLDASTRTPLRDGIGGIHLVDRLFRGVQQGDPATDGSRSTLRR